MIEEKIQVKNRVNNKNASTCNILIIKQRPGIHSFSSNRKIVHIKLETNSFSTKLLLEKIDIKFIKPLNVVQDIGATILFTCLSYKLCRSTRWSNG